MTEKTNSISEEASVRGAIKAMTGNDDWDGNPKSEPDYVMKAWWIDPYWYVCTSDGMRRVISDPNVLTYEDLTWSVGEQMRILTLEQFRKEVSKK